MLPDDAESGSVVESARDVSDGKEPAEPLFLPRMDTDAAKDVHGLGGSGRERDAARPGGSGGDAERRGGSGKGFDVINPEARRRLSSKYAAMLGNDARVTPSLRICSIARCQNGNSRCAAKSSALSTRARGAGSVEEAVFGMGKVVRDDGLQLWVGGNGSEERFVGNGGKPGFAAPRSTVDGEGEFTDRGGKGNVTAYRLCQCWQVRRATERGVLAPHPRWQAHSERPQ